MSSPNEEVATYATMDAHTVRGKEIPWASVNVTKSFVCKNTRWADIDKVSRKFTFQYTVSYTAEVDAISRSKNAEVLAECIVSIEANASVTRYASIHLVVNERTEILIPPRSFGETIASVIVFSENGHVLQHTFPALVTHWTIVGMIEH
jgi:hypothetical protein